MTEHTKQSSVGTLSSKRDAKKQQEERRASARYAFAATAQVVEMQSQLRVAGRISDLGLNGCYIDTISPLAAASQVFVRIQHAEREFAAQARVSFAHPSMGMGLAFTDVTPEHQAILNSWIAVLQGVKVEPQGGDPATAPQKSDLHQTLRELINLMFRKNLIDATEAQELLRLLPR